MNWVTLKETIRCDLLDRNLKDPKIRLRALDKIERILIEFYPEYITDTENISAVDKNVFKRQIEAKKGAPLNSAEKSVINDIYLQKISLQVFCKHVIAHLSPLVV